MRPEISIPDVTAVLRGAADYDALSTEEQAIVRAFWSERMAMLASSLRLDQELTADSKPWVELDEKGEIVRHDPEPRQGPSQLQTTSIPSTS